jgi:hypothetical protein
MGNPEHLSILLQGVDAWNRWRNANKLKPDLSKTDLSKMDLSGANLVAADLWMADLTGADLMNANLSKADLRRANLIATDLTNVNLRWAILIQAILVQADMSGADLSKAILSGAYLNETRLWRTNFRSCDMTGAYFAGSTMNQTIFAGVDLSLANGLEKVQHQGPSTIGIDTVYRSHGKIPEIFLRGAGVSDDLIAFIRAMEGPIQFYSCFISYSSKDQLFAERLYVDLQVRGVRCWFAPHDVQGGKKLHEQIDNAIQMHERLLLILSPDSIDSEWVKTEIAKARKREVLEKRRMLFPVLLKISYTELQEWECFDADTGKDSAREIREYYIPDFSEWERPEKFKEEFEKLVRDLKKAEAAK